jgi:uncharacterized protein (DUF2236 family)
MELTGNPMNEQFVQSDSIVRRIWGKSDTILFIFGGAAAEFALNKSVDWLYFTGKLPADPIGRLFSTVAYAKRIVFASLDEANKAIDTMRNIHQAVEKSRGSTIPDWAYRDVLFMLIHYSISSFELLERRLTEIEKEEVFDVFYRVGDRMGLVGLPTSYQDWLIMREDHLNKNLEKSHFTTDLFEQYKKHLGAIRYEILLQVQSHVVPKQVKSLLDLSNAVLLPPAILVYKLSRKINVDKLAKLLLLPPKYREQIQGLDRVKN